MQEHQPKAQPAPKAQWEPMLLTPVGNLGAVMQGSTGSKNEAGGMKP